MKSMQFDTRDTKPKVYSLIAVSAVAIALIAAFSIINASISSIAVCIIMAVWCMVSALILLYAFFEQIRYNPYSYNTMFYFGFALFLVSIFITYILLLFNVIGSPHLYTPETVALHFLYCAKNYMYFTFPFMLVFSIALCISNISLIRHEGKRFVNLLGIILSFFIVSVVVFLFIFDFYVTGSQTEVMIHDMIANFLASVYLYFECMLIGTAVANIVAVNYKPEKDKDFMLILGCGIKKDGTPTPLLRGRIERAIKFAKEQEEETGKELIFIPSGGKGSDEIISESECIKTYMLEQGIPENRIITENKSATTYENMLFSKGIIDSIDKNAKIAFSTTNYHVFRSGLFARRVKMRAVGIGAKTKWYFWPNAAVREFIGLLTKHKVKQAVILGTMVVLYASLTFLSYSI